ncbi:MAG: PfkB family carbohydrate kinase [bacterium]
MSLLVVGSIGLDTIQTPFSQIEDAIGGTAVFCGVTASYFTGVNLVGVVGEDFPRAELEYFRRRHIDLSGLEIKPGKSFRWGAKYHLDLNTRETLFTHLNVFETFKPKIPEKYRDTPFVFLGNIGPDLQLDVLDQVRHPKLVALDTMNYWIEGAPEALARVLKRIDVLLVNDSEARLLAREPNLVKAARQIRDLGPRIIIIKKGEHGAVMISGDQFFWAPAFPLENAFDPTGAGDTFAGGFMGFIAKAGKFDDATLRQAVVYGSTFASFCVERFSLERIRDLSWEEIHQRFAEFQTMTGFTRPWE